MYSEESLAFCAGQCQASRFPPASCRCICQGRNHGVLHSRGHVINITGSYGSPVVREYPVFTPGHAALTEQGKLPDLSETIRDLKASLEHDRASGYTGQHTDRGINLTKKNGKYRIAKGIGKALKHSFSGYSQDELNRRIRDGLRQQFNEENTDLAIDQAFVIRQSKQPDANRPELYELYETGELDQALEMMGKRWVIGRPKR